MVSSAVVNNEKSHTYVSLSDVLLQAVQVISENEEEASKVELQAKYASRSTLSHRQSGPQLHASCTPRRQAAAAQPCEDNRVLQASCSWRLHLTVGMNAACSCELP